MKISVVIPAYNEKENLPVLHAELLQTLEGKGELEIVYVDDGSRDGTWEWIASQQAGDARVVGIRMRRNMGKSEAYTAAFLEATGDVVLTLDADLQDNPQDIPALLAAIDGGLDLVVGWKKDRKDPWVKVLSSRIFNAVLSRTTKLQLHDTNTGFRAMRSEVAKELVLYGDLYRFIPALAWSRGFRVGEVAVNHRPRKFGTSKYGRSGLGRALPGFFDLFTVTFLIQGTRGPSRFFSRFGFWSFALGFVVNLYLAGEKVFTGVSIGDRPLLILGVLLMVVGLQVFATGLIADLIVFRGKQRSAAPLVAEVRRKT
jgi:glycosyltransferase involved in cell wall biosynthesis